MDSIKILIEGYAHPGDQGKYIASPTCLLIKSKGKKVLVDPGANQTKLLRVLKKENLTPDDIDIVFLSHYHLDHLLAIRLFPKKDIVDGELTWKEDLEIFHKNSFVPGTNIRIIKTPGHSSEQTSLVVKTEEYGTVCVAQDVFWWEDGKQKSDTVKELLALKDPFCNDEKALKESRKKVLDLADYIIPGHGKIFRNPQK